MLDDFMGWSTTGLPKGHGVLYCVRPIGLM